jgi:hypothetical protein
MTGSVETSTAGDSTEGRFSLPMVEVVEGGAVATGSSEADRNEENTATDPMSTTTAAAAAPAKAQSGTRRLRSS